MNSVKFSLGYAESEISVGPSGIQERNEEIEIGLQMR